MIGSFAQFRRENSTAVSVAFFLGGVLLDVLTLGRIDQPWALGRIALLLVACGLLLDLDLRAAFLPFRLEGRMARLWERREWAIHFLFGNLLSAYAIYYFKSASLLASGLFILALLGLLLANEWPVFKSLGPFVKFGLYGLCLSSYFAFLVPILSGALGRLEFVLSIVLSVAVILVNGLLLYRIARARRILFDAVLVPVAVQLAFLAFYFAGAIPPVPLSIKFIGIYHGVEKGEGRYTLLHERPEWRFWEKGDQIFLARPGDRIFLFARIFSPTRFHEQVELRWFRRESPAGWTLQDVIPLEIRGGREDGYRGVAVKANYVPGDWRVLVMTGDGREIGRISLEVLEDFGAGERSFVREEG